MLSWRSTQSPLVSCKERKLSHAKPQRQEQMLCGIYSKERFVTLKLFFILQLRKPQPMAAPYNVSYDGRSMIINGERKLLISGSIHYPRRHALNSLLFLRLQALIKSSLGNVWYHFFSSVGMWDDLLKKSKAAGLDIIETYVFWNLHEPVKVTPRWWNPFNINSMLCINLTKRVNCTLKTTRILWPSWSSANKTIFMSIFALAHMRVLRLLNRKCRRVIEYGHLQAVY